ncbi:hypothetical protein [Taibaiella soli]|uniref:Uncharacterized protein n=1 Tax=Taibaiella soli TaxID=1649169 RepID=A0A2W2B4F7_9BACT|nr:hypothetical protein [Taibaiella soli]PZF74938.1 hypothetical protein DN068_01705 [Taibaiella soli]
MSGKIILYGLLSLFAVPALAQTHTKKVTKSKTATTSTESLPKKVDLSKPVPDWENGPDNVYFPDYYMFYDPHRKSYVYWTGEKWATSVSTPSLIKDIDKSKVRIQILKDETLVYPENNIERYEMLYPAQPVFPTVPVPLVTITPKKKKK